VVFEDEPLASGYAEDEVEDSGAVTFRLNEYVITSVPGEASFNVIDIP
jgi:hypothetical protein